MAESLSDRLWKEYSLVFEDFDDMTLARWLSQTLGQLEGRCWRFSHLLIGAYRLAAELAHRRQIWLKRMANPPSAFGISPCCRAPVLPLLSRDVLQDGLICQHCSETLVPFEDLPAALVPDITQWANDYEPIHAVAHWDEKEQGSAADYDKAYDDAAGSAEKLLVTAGSQLAPRFLDYYPAILWEDQDECLDVRPEDITLDNPA